MHVAQLREKKILYGLPRLFIGAYHTYRNRLQKTAAGINYSTYLTLIFPVCSIAPARANRATPLHQQQPDLMLICMDLHSEDTHEPSMIVAFDGCKLARVHQHPW
jgi:hypothetical protein